MSNTILIGSLIIIAIVFFLFLYEILWKLGKANKLLKSLSQSDNIIESFHGTKIELLGESYKKSINIATPEGKKSNIPASIFINSENVAKSYKLNFRMLDTVSGTLVGLGLLGTFLGLTIGISGFDSSNSNNIQQSIQNLLGGMGTAFSTSLAGMLFSLIFTAFDKSKRNSFQRNLYILTEK